MSASEPWIVGDQQYDVRKHAPATLRNRGAIAETLRGMLPVAGLVLEVASGSGEHCAYLAETFPALDWQPSDPDAGARNSIAAWCAGLENVHAPLDLDAAAAAADWPVACADAMLCVNMVHISPWEATTGLMAGAGRLLGPGAPLILYGPFRRDGEPTAPSNLAFDESLRSRDQRWGLRSVDAVAAEAAPRGLRLAGITAMPANNLMLMFHRE